MRITASIKQEQVIFFKVRGRKSLKVKNMRVEIKMSKEELY
jgi:hypothetical protein